MVLWHEAYVCVGGIGVYSIPSESEVAKYSPASAVGAISTLQYTNKDQSGYADSQNCITVPRCKHAVYEWEFQDGDNWLPMDAHTSVAIEVRWIGRNWAADSASSALMNQKTFLVGNHQFDLSCMKQRNTTSYRFRSIRRGHI